MSLSIAIALTAAAVLPSHAAHETTVEHRGASYQVSYRPHVTTEMKTVGHAPGARMSLQQCRWTANVQVQRHIGRLGDGAAASKILPTSRAITGHHPGSCDIAGKAVETAIAAQDGKVRQHVIAIAQADHPHVLADIDAAHRLALN